MIIKKSFLFCFFLSLICLLSPRLNSESHFDPTIEQAEQEEKIKAENAIHSDEADELKLVLKNVRKNSYEQVEALFNLGLYYKEAALFDSAEYYFSVAQILAEKRGFQKILSNIHNGLGTVCYKRSDFNKALQHYQQAVDISTNIGDEKSNTSRLLNIGKIHFYQGDLNLALNYYQQAEINSETFYDDLGTAHAKKEIGSIFNQWQQYSQARDYYFQALHIYEELQDLKQKSIILNEIGSLYRREDNFEKAIEFQQKSLEIKEQIGYKYGIAASLNGLGITFKQKQQYPQALEYYQRALQIQKEINDEMGAAATISNIGLIQQKMGLTESALRSYQTSMQLARKIPYNQLLINNLIAISELYSSSGNYARSLDYLRQAVVIKDSIFNQEKHKQFAEMQTKYETEKKERENEQLRFDLELNILKMAKQETQRNLLLVISVIILISSLLIYVLYRLKTKAYQDLSAANKLILQQKQELELLNKTRNRFFSIISHDLRNALGSAVMGIELLDDSAEMEKQEISDVQSELKNSIVGLSNLLDNLLAWARLQIGRIHPQPVVFNLKEALDEVLITLRSKFINKKIDFVSDILDTTAVFADRNMVGSILQNLLTNAIKFSHEGGKIHISEKKDDKKIEISISDTGVGMADDILNKLFKEDEIISNLGTNFEKGSGLGLILCHEFVRKNGGDIIVESKPNRGTTIRFTLPLALPEEI